MDSVLNLLDGQVKFFGEIQITEELRTILFNKIFLHPEGAWNKAQSGS